MNSEYKHCEAEYAVEDYKLFNNDKKQTERVDSIKCCFKSDVKTHRNSKTVWEEIKSDKVNRALGLVYR